MCNFVHTAGWGHIKFHDISNEWPVAYILLPQKGFDRPPSVLTWTKAAGPGGIKRPDKKST